MRYHEITESISQEPFIELARKCETFDQFIRKTDGMDVLYRGHHGEHVGNNVFATDYVGHALEYAGDGGQVDGFIVDWNDVLFIKDRVFEDIRHTYRDATTLKQIYAPAIKDERMANAMMEKRLRTGSQVIKFVMKVLSGSTPYSDISINASINDLLIPILQHYAAEKGKNIIGFVGGDYDGDQNEFVITDVTRLPNLRDLYVRIKGSST